MRHAALILILVAALWAALAPPAGAQSPGPPPDVELPPQAKPPRPPQPPEEEPPPPPEPTEPTDPTEPPAPEEPAPPPEEPPTGGETPPTGGSGGSTGGGTGGSSGGGGTTGGGASGGGTASGGSQADARTAGAGFGAGPLTLDTRFGLAAGERGRDVGSARGSDRAREAPSSPAAAGEADAAPATLSFGVPEAGRTAAPAEDPTRQAPAAEEIAGVGVVPLAVLAVGLALVSVGVAAGLVRMHGWRPWQPGSRA